jgi:hypothetical protein
MESSKQNIFIEWAFWQFYEMPMFLLGVWGNYFVFATNYFSLMLLLKTLFSPWRGYKWKYPKWFEVVEFFNTLISNTVSRMLGAFMRIILIVAGICLQIFVAVAGSVIFIAWFLIPFIAAIGFLFILIY